MIEKAKAIHYRLDKNNTSSDRSIQLHSVVNVLQYQLGLPTLIVSLRMAAESLGIRQSMQDKSCLEYAQDILAVLF